MLNEVIRLLLVSTFLTQASVISEGPAKESITISGYIEQTGLYNKLPIYLQMDEGHPYAFVYIKIYVNDILVIDIEEVTKFISSNVYEIEGFTYANEIKNIRIEVNYLENHVDTSICNIKFQGPSFDKHKSNYTNSYIATDNNPIKTYFTFKGNTCEFKSEYEHVAITSSYVKTTDTRYLTFSDLNISLFNIYDTLQTCELRLFCELENSDMLFKNNQYTSIDLPLIQIDDNSYKIKDEYRFYVSDKTGMIYESYNDDCHDELYPLFIPLSLGEDVLIDYEIYFHDIGLNNSDYIYKGNYHLYSLKHKDEFQYGSILSYRYKQIYEELKDVKYA